LLKFLERSRNGKLIILAVRASFSREDEPDNRGSTCSGYIQPYFNKNVGSIPHLTTLKSIQRFKNPNFGTHFRVLFFFDENKNPDLLPSTSVHVLLDIISSVAYYFWSVELEQAAVVI